MASDTVLRIEAIIKAIPYGRVMTYGMVAKLAGLPNGARLVVRVLHSRSEISGLPWHRLVRKNGDLALPEGGGRELQVALLEAEGVAVSPTGRVDLDQFQYYVRPEM